MMIKTILIALVYFLIGLGIASCCDEKKNNPGFVVFVLIFWPLVLGVLVVGCVLFFTLGFIVMGIEHLREKWRGE